MERRVLLIVFLWGVCLQGLAQSPVISAITPSVTYPGDRLVITGSGFSSTSSQLQVWFNHVKGTINSSSEFSIDVTVPASARHGVLEVINLTTRLSVKSPFKFTPSYSGLPFDPAKLGTPLTFSGSNELFDLCSCDLNADGKPDFAVTQFDLETDLIVLQNQSTPGAVAFNRLDKSNLASLNIGAPTEKVVCGDLNGDGKPELITSRSGATKNIVYVLPNTSSGTISFGPVVSLL
ncbi:MAG TPA: VCBS repeat-containing protein, partial [Cyclobacteriaceae bacterium]|nr:VCBS repeat-containing protein [Cyclobacteriaceae bacterium]